MLLSQLEQDKGVDTFVLNTLYPNYIARYGQNPAEVTNTSNKPYLKLMRDRLRDWYAIGKGFSWSNMKGRR